MTSPISHPSLPGNGANGPASQIDLRPEWLRLPRSRSKCPYSGLSRSTLNQLVLPCPANDGKPPVRSVVVRQRGALRGIRLINFDSLMTHLNALTEEERAC